MIKFSIMHKKDDEKAPSTVTHEHSIIPFEWAIKKVLGPTFESLGNDIKAGYEKTKKKIFTSAEKKLRPSQKDGRANLRIAWNILSQASFSESDIGAEYFGGILAASNTEDGQDDSGIYFLEIAKSISSKQILLHYILYTSLNKLLVAKGEKLNVAMASELASKTVYFKTAELNNLGINIDTDFFALSSKNLIAETWTANFKEISDKESGNKYLMHCVNFKPTPLGIQMLAIAHNRLDEYRSFNKVEFPTIPEILLPNQYSFSINDLKV